MLIIKISGISYSSYLIYNLQNNFDEDNNFFTFIMKKINHIDDSLDFSLYDDLFYEKLKSNPFSLSFQLIFQTIILKDSILL